MGRRFRVEWAAVAGLATITLWSAACATGRPTSSLVDVRMWIHFDQAAEMQFALVRGDLDLARDVATQLARPRRIEGIPPGSEGFLEAVRVHAREVAASSSLDQAAGAASGLAGACGRCHREYDVGPVLAVDPARPDPGSDHMVEHLWGLDRLWEGLVIPSSERWQAGARILAEHEVPMELLPPGTSQLGVQLKTLGLEASNDRALEARVSRLGEVLRTCASCHSRSRGED